MNGSGKNKYLSCEGILLFFLLVLHLSVQVINAWMSDDALITCRSIYNFVNGHGLVWNTTERVQAFTHPLWLFLITPFYCISGEFSKTIMLLSIGISYLVMLILVFRFATNILTALILVIAMTVSTAYMDYSTSGLENPLTHLLLIMLVWVSSKETTNKTALLITLLFSFIILTRLDLLLLISPLCLFILRNAFKHTKSTWVYILIGLTPFLLWEIFSLFYYGFLVPNTYYAKVHAGVEKSDLLLQGVLYFVDSIIHDFITLPLIVTGTILGLLHGRKKSEFWLSIGIILYMMYIIWIGGDFMRGRFFSAPFVAAMIIIARIPFQPLMCLMFSLILIALGIVNDTTLRFDKSYENKPTSFGIADERGYYHPMRNLLQGERPNYLQPLKIEKTKPDAWPHERKVVTLGAGAGIIGLTSGPYIHVLDQCALGDPLLSKISISGISLDFWRVGHYSRDLPHGYKQSLEQSQNLIRHQSLAQYYDQLLFNISGPLFSIQRISNIALMNFGYYDKWLDDYNQRFDKPMKMQLDELSTYLDGVGWTDPRVTIIYEGGLVVDLGETKHPQTINVSFDNNDQYQLTFYQSNSEIGNFTIGPTSNKVGIASNHLDLSETSVQQGFDRIFIKPKSGDGIYCIGHLRLE